MMVYREKIQLPTNTFTNLMAVRLVFSLIHEELYSILMCIILKRTKERVSPKQNAKKETKKIPTAKYMAIRLRYTFQILLKLIFALPNIKINVKYIWPSNWTILIPKQSQTWKQKQYQLDVGRSILKVKTGHEIIAKFSNQLEQLIQDQTSNKI